MRACRLFGVDEIAEIVGREPLKVYEQLATAERAIMNEDEATGTVLAAQGAPLESDPRRRRLHCRQPTK